MAVARHHSTRILALCVAAVVVFTATGCQERSAFDLTDDGLALVRAGQQGRALRRFERAIRVDPAYPYGYYYAAGIYNGRHQWARAERYLDRFLELRPDDANGWYTLAFCLDGQARDLLGEAATDLHGEGLRRFAATHPSPSVRDQALAAGLLARAAAAYAKAAAGGLPLP
ncbi:MAG: hypothetical protein COW73_05995 [Nitrospirae bacterium CG18_big_fil_WC_8_21_14_2_50_70_55]|nr:tetratricopeptide repeat protein [Deltaproteobacteria bacterium]OIP63380.1 MAG: hypothetical protein AUK30_08560 [Nitrospirae bacterium CG2_30_70_394]PIQ05397.1 MAG: hypothetical protein COW73_05995 [Nitrospirae bacterium CG18_big_fil_WC_8_21_14_2_50_70_55]PIW83518.1 MAG: hypothetical protein COZ96_03060 [Nitrospirae bacterium CG_4_8_14_3_um_filter_70_85]PIX84305.1 MAG: hypothetical protein COZ33_00985 [Nitrospirae bacterium CG_4_10_14_3_um_filter_70_108]